MSIKFFLSITGILLLVLGSFYSNLPDWDVLISILMGGLTTIYSPRLIRSLREEHGHAIVNHLILMVFIVDWLYVNYNEYIGATYVREANLTVSIPLYVLTGIVLYYAGKFDEAMAKKHLRTSVSV